MHYRIEEKRVLEARVRETDPSRFTSRKRKAFHDIMNIYPIVKDDTPHDNYTHFRRLRLRTFRATLKGIAQQLDHQEGDGNENGIAAREERDVICLCRGPERGMMVECEGCLNWYHSKCLGLIGPIKAIMNWTLICPSCYQHHHADYLHQGTVTNYLRMEASSEFGSPFYLILQRSNSTTQDQQSIKGKKNGSFEGGTPEGDRKRQRLEHNEHRRAATSPNTALIQASPCHLDAPNLISDHLLGFRSTSLAANSFDNSEIVTDRVQKQYGNQVRQATLIDSQRDLEIEIDAMIHPGYFGGEVLSMDEVAKVSKLAWDMGAEGSAF